MEEEALVAEEAASEAAEAASVAAEAASVIEVASEVVAAAAEEEEAESLTKLKLPIKASLFHHKEKARSFETSDNGL